MGVKTFAAIDVGSYELSMKIFEFNATGGMREIDHIRHRLDLGTQTYATGKLRFDDVDELCHVLKEFQTIMKTYRVEDYRAYGTSAIRESENMLILLDQIKNRTGITVEVLSNSEQRFLDYKSIALKGDKFNRIIEKGTAIIDIGGGSLQISLFNKDTLIATQNIRLGILRIKEMLNKLQPRRAQMDDLMSEIIGNQLEAFKKLYLSDNKINNIIVVDDYVSMILQKKMAGVTKQGFLETQKYASFLEAIHSKTESELANSLGISEENVLLLTISTALIMNLIHIMGAELLWAPGVTLCDGIAYEYAEKHNKTTFEHDFEKDILACARNIRNRYMGSHEHGATIEQITLTIYDAMKRVHGLGKRERLLLQLASILQDCGKFVSLANVGMCSFSIIMSTEIIGLSHVEREMIAHIVKFTHDEFRYYSEMGQTTTLDQKSFLVIAKLTAILRLANGLELSNKQKCKNIVVNLKDNELILGVPEGVDLFLEKGLFDIRTDFFMEVYSIKPIIKISK